MGADRGGLYEHLVADNSTAGSHCEKDGDPLWARPLGITMGVVGSFMINVGQNVQASALQSSPAVQKNPPGSRLWRIGTATFALGAIINFSAFAFAPTSVLVPIESLQFVVNVGYGHFVNMKQISKRMLIGVALTMFGTVCCVVSGPQDGECFTIDQMVGFWLDGGWWAWLICSIIAALAALYTHKTYGRRLEIGDNPPHHRIVLPVTYAISSALLGGANMIVHSKVISELLSLQIQRIEPWPIGHWFLYVELLLLITMGGFWLHRMNEALSLYDPLFIIPLLQSAYILFGVSVTVALSTGGASGLGQLLLAPHVIPL